MFTSPRARQLMAIGALLALVLSTIAMAVTVAADAAPIHSPQGEMEITKAEATSPTTIRVEAGIVYADDQHLATGAVVNAQLTGPGGATVGPVTLSRLDEDSSIYGADVAVPRAGAWQVTVTSMEPDATASADVEVQAATTTTAAETTTTGSTSTSAATSTSTTAGATSTSRIAAAQDESDDDNDGGSRTGLIAVLVMIGVVIGGGAAWYFASKRGSAADTGSDDDGMPPAAP